jgi:hypothetical protein
MDGEDQGNCGGIQECRRQFAAGGGLWEYLANNALIVARFGGPIDEQATYSPSPEKADTVFVHAGLEGRFMTDFVQGTIPAVDMRTGREYDNIYFYNHDYPRTEFIPALVAPAGWTGWSSFVAEMNNGARRILHGEDSGVFGLHSSSPVWSRRYTQTTSGRNISPWSEHKCEEIDQLLSTLRVSRIIVGHTPQENNRVLSRCGGKLLVVDITMSRGFHRGGQPAAVVMTLTGENALSGIFMHYTHPDPTRLNESVEIH